MGQTDGRIRQIYILTLDRVIDPAPHTMRVVSVLSAISSGDFLYSEILYFDDSVVV